MLCDRYADMWEPSLADAPETAVPEFQTSPALRAIGLDEVARIRKPSNFTQKYEQMRPNSSSEKDSRPPRNNYIYIIPTTSVQIL